MSFQFQLAELSVKFMIFTYGMAQRSRSPFAAQLGPFTFSRNRKRAAIRCNGWLGVLLQYRAKTHNLLVRRENDRMELSKIRDLQKPLVSTSYHSVLLSTMTHGLDSVSAWIDHESAKIIGMIVRPQSRWPVSETAGP